MLLNFKISGVSLQKIYGFILFVSIIVFTSCSSHKGISVKDNITVKEVFLPQDSIKKAVYVYNYKKLSRFTITGNQINLFSIKTDTKLDYNTAYAWTNKQFDYKDELVPKLKWVLSKDEIEEYTKRYGAVFTTNVINLRLIACGDGSLYQYRHDLPCDLKNLRFLEFYFVFNDKKEITFRATIETGDKKE